MGAVPSFESFAARKTREAREALIHPLVTIEDRSSELAVETIGNPWSRRLYDGSFHVVALKPASADGGGLPSISLVFVQSKDGNTGTDNPEDLGGGTTDKHLIYEGLSRVAVDGVLAGATTAFGKEVFFSVWHPELVALRTSLGLPRHPAQIVMTRQARINPESSLIFNAPDVPVIVIGSVPACTVLKKAARARPWMHLVEMDGDDLTPALGRLRTAFDIRRISCIGGRTTATRLIDGGLVQDICLTTTARAGGQPNTPFYTGRTPPVLAPMVRKRGLDPHAPILFEHLALG